MNLKRFLVCSFIIHILVFLLAVFFLNTLKETKPGDEFFARLVSPDEFLPREVPAVPPVRAVPPVPSAPSAPRAAPLPRSPSSVAPPSVPDKGAGTLPENREKQPQPPLPPQAVLPPAGQQSPGQPGREGVQRPETLPGRSLREKLFDRAVINDLAKKEDDTRETDKTDKTFTLDTSEYKFLIYNKRLKEKIESIWIYPPDAAARGIYGDLVIRFTIRKNGRLGAVELVRTSGHKSLDDAAMKALKDGEPYWPLPDNWGMEAYTIQGHFVYTLYGLYVR